MINMKKINQLILIAAVLACVSFSPVFVYAQEASEQPKEEPKKEELTPERMGELDIVATGEGYGIGNAKKEVADAQANLKAVEKTYQEEKAAATKCFNDAKSETEKKKCREARARADEKYGIDRKAAADNVNAALKNLREKQQKYVTYRSTYKPRTAQEEAYLKQKAQDQGLSLTRSFEGSYLEAKKEYDDLVRKCNKEIKAGKEVSEECKKLDEEKAYVQKAYEAYKQEQSVLRANDAENTAAARKAQAALTEATQKQKKAAEVCDYYNTHSASSSSAKQEIKDNCKQGADGRWVVKDEINNEVNSAQAALDTANNALTENRWQTDENGDIITDENGNPIAMSADDIMKESDAWKTQQLSTNKDKFISPSSGEPIFSQITTRAATFLLGIRPIVYVLAGFGLIGFAWMAIFNKISFKWFANIAMGLFLVANMGNFIKYFVYKDGLAPTPVALNHGNHLGSGGANGTGTGENSYSLFVPEGYSPEEMQLPVSSDPEKQKKTRGFCGKTENVSGFGNFSSCIKDIISTGKKAVDTVKTAKNTVKNVKNTINSIKNAAENIGDAFKNAGSLEGMVNAIGTIGSNVNNMVGAAGGLVNNTMNSLSKISNDVQDLGKSTDEVAELNKRRAAGEGTNAFDRALKGQTIGVDGEVERTSDGKIATDNNFWTGLSNGTKEVVNQTRQGNTLLQGAVGTASQAASVIGNTSVSDLTGGILKNDSTVNDKIREERKRKENRKKEKAEEEKFVQDWLNNTDEKKQERREQERKEANEAYETAKNTAQEKNDAYQNAQKAYDDAVAKAKSSNNPKDIADVRKKQQALEKAAKEKKMAEDAQREAERRKAAAMADEENEETGNNDGEESRNNGGNNSSASGSRNNGGNNSSASGSGNNGGNNSSASGSGNNGGNNSSASGSGNNGGSKPSASGSGNSGGTKPTVSSGSKNNGGTKPNIPVVKPQGGQNQPTRGNNTNGQKGSSNPENEQNNENIPELPPMITRGQAPTGNVVTRGGSSGSSSSSDGTLTRRNPVSGSSDGDSSSSNGSSTSTGTGSPSVSSSGKGTVSGSLFVPQSATGEKDASAESGVSESADNGTGSVNRLSIPKRSTSLRSNGTFSNRSSGRYSRSTRRTIGTVSSVSRNAASAGVRGAGGVSNERAQSMTDAQARAAAYKARQEALLQQEAEQRMNQEDAKSAAISEENLEMIDEEVLEIGVQKTDAPDEEGQVEGDEASEETESTNDETSVNESGAEEAEDKE